jgi:hypothetical protein
MTAYPAPRRGPSLACRRPRRRGVRAPPKSPRSGFLDLGKHRALDECAGALGCSRIRFEPQLARRDSSGLRALRKRIGDRRSAVALGRSILAPGASRTFGIGRTRRAGGRCAARSHLGSRRRAGHRPDPRRVTADPGVVRTVPAADLLTLESNRLRWDAPLRMRTR